MARLKILVNLFVWLILSWPYAAAANDAIRVGSKKFTESVILADIASDLARSTGAQVIHRQELGGTRILWDALLTGEIDLYPEYTGTLMREILAGDGVTDEASLVRILAAHGIKMSRSLGFSDTYALGMTSAAADYLNIRTISDLAAHGGIRFGLSNEFLNRSDGWPSLRDAYGLSDANLRGLDHDLAYRALAAGSIDVTDLYTTDAEITVYKLRVLDDDRGHFPNYDAVLLYRNDLETRDPKALRSMLELQGRIDTSAMIAMNRAVQIDHHGEVAVAADFVAANFGQSISSPAVGIVGRILERTLEHLTLTLISLAAAIGVAIPLGILAARHRRSGQAILTAVSIVQTIPSLALLVMMIPILGIGGPPAIAALFLYSLLPIVRNTSSGLLNISPSIRNSAIAIGLRPMHRLRLVELPMALPAILAGIKTAAVINVGTATLGALIGAGGYGQPILTGIRLNDFGLIMEGAVPAAVLALAVQALFDLAERYMVPRGLRLPSLS